MQLAITFLAAILAGYGLAHLPTSALITPGMASFFSSIGGLVMIIFSLALIFIAGKSLFTMFRGM